MSEREVTLTWDEGKDALAGMRAAYSFMPYLSEVPDAVAAEVENALHKAQRALDILHRVTREACDCPRCDRA